MSDRISNVILSSRATRAILPPLFFLAWAILFTYPLVLHLADAVVLSRGGDAWLHLWDLWWVDKALVGLHQNPYKTDFLLYPSGLNLYYHSLNIFNGVISIPLQHIFGLTTTFNLLVLGNLVLDGMAAYWLCMERTEHFAGSIVGGALFASAPLLATSVDLGQLDEITAWWMPLFVLALLRALECPGPVWRRGGGRRAALCAGLCLVGASLATWYFTAGLVIFTMLFVPAYLLANKRGAGKSLGFWWQACTKVGAAVVLFIVLLSPLLYAMVRERLRGYIYMLPSLSATIYNSADLLAPFMPPRIGAQGFSWWSADAATLGYAGNSTLGYVALLLSGLGLAWGRRKLCWPIALALLGLVVMSLGPDLLVAGNDTHIPLPYALLNNVPFIGASRQPLRFLAAAGVCLSVLSAFGVSYLTERLRLPALRRALLPALLLLIMAELFGIPRQLTSTVISPAFSSIKARTEAGAVMELPVDSWSALSMWHQSLHDKPIIGGYTSRHFPYPLALFQVPGVAQLYRADAQPLGAADIISPTLSDTALSGLDQYGVRYVVLHKADMRQARYIAIRDAFNTLFAGRQPIYDDPETAVYVTPRSNSVLPIVALGEGWYAVEGDDTASQPLHRWTNGNSPVALKLPGGAGGRYTLRLTAYSYHIPRELTISIDGRQASTAQVSTGFSDITADLGRLQPGDHTLLFASKQPPEVPQGDLRAIAVGYTRLVVEKAR
ncbi:MAG: hypothetical protein M3014_08100 [Chloroflexota bacterium]|nr:hypothetical protein [Chloroflexota bacterium]